VKNECEMEREKYICQTPAEVAGHKARQRGRKGERIVREGVRIERERERERENPTTNLRLKA